MVTYQNYYTRQPVQRRDLQEMLQKLDDAERRITAREAEHQALGIDDPSRDEEYQRLRRRADDLTGLASDLADEYEARRNVLQAD